MELNPHSVHIINKHKEGIYAVALDNLNIIYTINIKKAEVRIVKILYVDNTKIGSQSLPHESEYNLGFTTHRTPSARSRL